MLKILKPLPPDRVDLDEYTRPAIHSPTSASNGDGVNVSKMRAAPTEAAALNVNNVAGGGPTGTAPLYGIPNNSFANRTRTNSPNASFTPPHAAIQAWRVAELSDAQAARA